MIYAARKRKRHVLERNRNRSRTRRAAVARLFLPCAAFYFVSIEVKVCVRLYGRLGSNYRAHAIVLLELRLGDDFSFDGSLCRDCAWFDARQLTLNRTHRCDSKHHQHNDDRYQPVNSHLISPFLVRVNIPSREERLLLMRVGSWGIIQVGRTPEVNLQLSVIRAEGGSV